MSSTNIDEYFLVKIVIVPKTNQGMIFVQQREEMREMQRLFETNFDFNNWSAPILTPGSMMRKKSMFVPLDMSFESDR